MIVIFNQDTQRTWSFDDRTGRYRDKKSGRFLSKDAVTTLTTQNLAAENKELRGYLAEVIQGERSLIDFSVRAAETVKKAHIQEYLLGRGGLANAKDSEYLAIGRSLKDLHYPAIKRFTEDLKTGKLSEAQAYQRLSLILNASKQSYGFGEKQSRLDGGMEWARRYLGIAEHCPDCVGYASLGVVLAATIIPPATNCQCGGNCKCYLKYAKTREELAG